jgi:hypothetical protein
MADIISWIATGATIVAAFMTASNLVQIERDRWPAR